MRRPIVAGNWKMNGSAESVTALARAVGAIGSGVEAEVGVCPPFVYLDTVRRALGETSVWLGAQSVSEHAGGAYTGEIAASMLSDLGCTYVIVGHSERRQLCGETDAQVSGKFRAAQAAGLIPLLCVGELLSDRDRGATEAVVGRQLSAVLDACGVDVMAGAVVAYEPVWAIGTGKTATPDEAQAVHEFIRATIAGASREVAGRLRILYGGSVKAQNAAALFSMPDIDGGLIGGAALDAQEFLQICRAAGQG